MNVSLKISLLLFCCVILSHCKKKENNCDTLTEGVAPYLVTNFKFLPGTYWNFVNEISNDTNLILVSSTETHKEYTFISKGGPEVMPCRHKFYFTQINLSDANVFQLTEDKITICAPGGYGSITLNQMENHTFGGIFIDTLALPTGNYYSVYKSKGGTEGIKTNFDSSYFYFNEAFGIVRKELYKGGGIYESWNLSSATIVR